MGIKVGKSKRPFKGAVYGVPSVGKTTFASKAPKPLFLCVEDGARDVDCARWVYEEGKIDRVTPKNYEEFRTALTGAAASNYETLVIDGLGTLDKLIQESLLKRNPKWGTIASGAGGFGNGENAVLQDWREFFAHLEELNLKGFNILLVGHSKLVDFKNPEGNPFSRYIMDVQNHPRGNVAGLLFEQLDFVGFARFEQMTREEGKRTVTTAMQGARILCLQKTDTYDAKFRSQATNIPAQIPFNWTDFARLLERGDVSETQVRGQILDLLPRLPEDKQNVLKTWLESGNLTIDDLVQGLDRVKASLIINAA